MAEPAGIKIEGLKELRRMVGKLPEVKTGLRQDFLALGKKIASDAASRVPKKSGRAASSLRAGVSGNNAYIAGGKANVPYFGWLDFGSREPIVGNLRSQGPWLDSGKGPTGGRFIYPAIARNDKEIKKAALKAVDRALNEL